MQKRTPKRLPLDLPVPQVRQRSPRYRGGTRDKFDEINKTASLLRKIFVSAIIIILVIVLKSIDTDFTQNIVGYVRDGITNDIDIDETLGKLKFVSNYLPDAKAVFGQQSDDIQPFFTVPAEGKVVKPFEQDNLGIDISGTKNDNVYAVADGLVMAAGEDGRGGKFLKINHGNDIITLYEGCFQILANIGDKVTKGERIGTMGENPSGGYGLRFEAMVDNKPVDPLKLIEMEK